MTDNWYLILGLDFDKPDEDEKVIADRIAEQKKIWSRKAREDAFKGSQYKKLLESIPHIKRDMIGADNRRKQLAEEACNEIYSPVDEYLKGVEKNGEITEDEGKRIAEKIAEEIPERKAKYIPGNRDYKKAAEKLDVANAIDIVKKRADKLGIKWNASASLEHYQVIYDKYYKSELQNASVFDEVKEKLERFFDVDNLYDFLCAELDAPVNSPSSLPCEELRKRASEKRSKFNKHDEDSITGSRLCSQCEKIFQDESSKKVYDQYLEYTNCRVILDNVKKIAGVSLGSLPAEKGYGYIDQLTQIFKDSKLAEEVFIAFCKVENIFCDVKERTREARRPEEPERPRESERPREPERPRESEKPKEEEKNTNGDPMFSDVDWNHMFEGFQETGWRRKTMDRDSSFKDYHPESGKSERTKEYEKSREQKLPIRPERRKGTASRSLFELVRAVAVIGIGIMVLGELGSLIVRLGSNRVDKKSETAETDRYEAFLNEFEKSIEESDNNGDTSEQENSAAAPEQEDPAAVLEQGQEDPAATTEQENERDKYTDEEWFLATVDGGVPHGFTREDRGGDDIDYIHAGGRSYNFLGIQLAKDLRVWAEEKEKEEGEGYWADGHIEGITDSSDVEWTLRQTLSLLDRRALVRYAEEVMESGLWEELRTYVGDEKADEMDQELYELIQNEKDIFARMAEQNQKKE